MDPTTSTLFHRTPDTSWQASPPVNLIRTRTRSSNKKTYVRSALHPSPAPKQNAVPVSILEDPDEDHITPNIGTSPLCSCTSSPMSIPDTLEASLSTDPFYKRLIGPLLGPVQEQGKSVAESIALGTLLVCSDGSYSSSLKKGSHGWIFATEQQTLWKGAGPVDGHPDMMNPYRAELGGLVSVLHILTTISTHYKISSGELTVYSNCLSAIKHVQHSYKLGLTHHLAPDYDLLNEGRTLLNQLQTSCKVTLKWIKGHFKGKKSIAHKLNEIAHNLAYSYLKEGHVTHNPQKLVYDPPSYEVSFQYNGSTITFKLPSYISQALYSKSLRDTICKNENWTVSTFNKVDWQAYYKNMQTTTRSHRISLIKISHNLLNTNHQNKKYYNTSDICPCCQQQTETFVHMLTCRQKPP
jgi:hypothetical protein